MEIKDDFVDPLLERAEAYSKTTFALVKLRAMDKVSDLVSMTILHLLLITIGGIFMFGISVGLALWIGALLGKVYLGFMLLASCYAVLGLVLFFSFTSIKARIQNTVLTTLID